MVQCETVQTNRLLVRMYNGGSGVEGQVSGRIVSIMDTLKRNISCVCVFCCGLGVDSLTVGQCLLLVSLLFSSCCRMA